MYKVITGLGFDEPPRRPLTIDEENEEENARDSSVPYHLHMSMRHDDYDNHETPGAHESRPLDKNGHHTRK